MLAMFLSALEQTIVAPALPAIGKSLGGIDDLSWVVTAYLLAATAATPLFGKLSDIYGRRALLLVAIGIFIAGSVACALAPTIWVLILPRAAARHWRRRVVADRADHHRRPAVAARAPGGAGPHLDHVHERQHSRPGARRFAHRPSALVAHFLDQSAARRCRAGDDRARAAPPAAQSTGRISST